VVGCEAGHRFDVARQGYVPLLGSRARIDTGDDARMVAARAEFLFGGWYAPVADAVAVAAGEAAADAGGGAPVVEVGAGTGYYLAAARGDRRGLAIDASRYALRRAARQPGLAAVLADAWAPLPVADGLAAAVLSVFAPRDPAELVRITGPGGRIVVVTPESDHLAELRGPLPLLAVDAGKAVRVVQAFAGLPVTPLQTRAVRYPMALSRAAVTNLVAMGPTARHLDAAALGRAVSGLDEPVVTTVSVTVTTLARHG